MPSLITHGIIPGAICIGTGNKIVSNRLLVFCILCSILPDVDVIGFKLGIPYSSQWGHRGFMHLVFFAFCIAVLSVFLSRILKSSPLKIFLAVLVSAVSHPLLDAFTNGGLGVALWWPFSDARIFFSWHPVKVSPIGIRRFFSEWGVSVIKSEILWIWLPLFSAGIAAFLSRMIFVQSLKNELNAEETKK